MPEIFEQHFAHQEETEETKPKTPEQIKEEKALELAQEIKAIKERIAVEGAKEEDYQKIIELVQEIKNIYKGKRIIGWQKEGVLSEKDVLTEYQAGSVVWAANFSPEGDKVVIGSADKMMRVISLTEKEGEKPKVLTEYQAEGRVYAANFSPEGDKVVIGSEDGMMRVIG